MATLNPDPNYICIACNANPLHAEESEKDTFLVCSGCNAKFPVVNGISRFVKSDHYVGNFSFEWNIHRKTQIDTADQRNSEAAFYLRFGLQPDYFKGKKVLDVGVGAGRYADVALRAGAEVWGIDLSFSVEAARENLSKFDEQISLAQADLFNPPFAPETFDVIYSFGVLHHTPDPPAAFDGLVKLLKPGGIICITTYTDYGMYFTSQYARKFTTRLPARMLYPLTTIYTLLLYVPYKYLGFRHGILGRVLPISLSASIGEAILDTYDCYSPKYQFCYPVHEVFGWFKKNGLEGIEARPQPTTVLGRKPAK